MEKSYQSDHRLWLGAQMGYMKVVKRCAELNAVGNSQQNRCQGRIDHLERMDAAEPRGLHESGNAGGEP